MAATSTAAADEIRSFVERAINLANEKSADAALYAHDAITATDTIIYLEGTGDVGGFVPPTLQTIPSTTLPNFTFDDTLDLPALISEIKGIVQDSFTSFFQTNFTNDLTAHDTAVRQLSQIADRANIGGALDKLNTKSGSDDQARTYLNGRFSATSDALTKVREDLSMGSYGTQYLNGRLVSGNSATDFLVRKFQSGDSATTTLLQMLAGGSVMPPAVEDQIYQRDRSRLLNEAARVEQQAIDSMAARGYPLPPGAAIMMRYQTQSDAQDKIAQASRDVAIKQAETLIENIRIAAKELISDASQAGVTTMEGAATASRALVEASSAATRITLENAQQAAQLLIADAQESTKILIETAQRSSEALVPLRFQAVQAAADYVKAIISGASSAADVQRAVIDGQARAAEVVERYFAARVQAAASYNSAAAALADVQLKPLLASAENRTRLHMAKGSTDVGIASAKTTAALGAAQAAGNQGAAAISTLNAIASLTSSD